MFFSLYYSLSLGFAHSYRVKDTPAIQFSSSSPQVTHMGENLRPTWENQSLHCGGFFLLLRGREDGSSLVIGLTREMILFTWKQHLASWCIWFRAFSYYTCSIAPALNAPQLTSHPTALLWASSPLRNCLCLQAAQPWQQGRGEGESTPGEREVKLAARGPPCWVGCPSFGLTSKWQYMQWLNSQGIQSLACSDHLLFTLFVKEGSSALK